MVTGRTQGHIFPPPNAKELSNICVTVNWYPATLSISLDSAEGEGRVQWRSLECRVRVLCDVCRELFCNA